MANITKYIVTGLLLLTLSVVLVSSSNIDYSYPNDPWIDRVLSLNQSGNQMIISNLSLESLNITNGNFSVVMPWYISFGGFTFPYSAGLFSNGTNYVSLAGLSDTLYVYGTSDLVGDVDIDGDVEISQSVNIQDDLSVSDHISCNGIEPSWIHIGGVPRGGFYVDTWNANFSVPVDILDDLNVTGNITADHFIVGGLVRAGIGNCAEGYVMQNSTESGVECISVLSTTYYLNSSAVTGGTYTDTNIITDAWYYNGASLNFTEAGGANPLDIYLNFTNVSSFSQLTMREYYLGSTSHHMQVQIWDYGDGAWEDYFDFVGQEGMNVIEIPVYDYLEHINNSIVQVRLHHVQNGITSHRLYLDFAWLIEGSSVGASTNLDGYAKYSFGYNDFVGNGYFNTTGDVCVNGLCLSSAATSGGLWTNVSGTAEYDGNVNITGNYSTVSKLIICDNGTATIMTRNRTLATEKGCS